MPERIDRVIDLARSLSPHMVELRREIHANPETGWNEVETTRRVAEALSALGLEMNVRADGVGGHVDIGADPIVGFRGDLDGLPIQEEATPPYRSQVDGVMHGCGHDVHTAIAVGIAGVLAGIDHNGPGVRIIFQPAEEKIPGGANSLREEGVHRGLEALIAFHVDPALEVGKVGARVGAITSASDRIAISLTGPGGHTSRPHQTVDLLRAAGNVLAHLPGRLRIGVDPREPMAVVFGRVQGGSVENVVPTRVELGGTVRVFDATLWREMPKRVNDAVAALVGPFGAEFDVSYFKGAPPVVNDAAVTEVFAAGVRSALGIESIEQTHQSLGSEDLAWFLEDLPGAMFRLGARLPDKQVDLHSAYFDVDERCIENGIRAGAAALLALVDRSVDDQ